MNENESYFEKHKDAYQKAYEACLKTIPLLSSKEYIREGDECYCVQDMEFFAQGYCVSWKEALAASVEHSAVYNSLFTRIQAAILLRDHPCLLKDLREEFGYIRAWWEEIWQSAGLFDCGRCSPDMVASYIDFRGKKFPKKITKISLLADVYSDNYSTGAESIGKFEVKSEKELIFYAVREWEKLKMQGKKIVFRNEETDNLILLPGWAKKEYYTDHTVYGITLSEFYCPEYKRNPDDQFDGWNDEWYGSRLTLLFDYDPDYQENFDNCPLFSKESRTH